MSLNLQVLEKSRSTRKRRVVLYVILLVMVFAVLEAFVLAYKPPKDALLFEPEVSFFRDDSLLGQESLPLLLSSGGDPDFISGEYSFMRKRSFHPRLGKRKQTTEA